MFHRATSLIIDIGSYTYLRVIYLMQDISCVQKAVNDLANNTSFLLLLKVILEIGNFLNGGTFRGRAAGFKLASLATVRLYQLARCMNIHRGLTSKRLDEFAYR